MTTLYRNGMFWIIDTATGVLVETFPPFDTWQQARDAIGDRWVEPDIPD